MSTTPTVRAVRRPGRDEIDRAREVVRTHLRPTPLLPGPEMFLKLESMQPTGSFKVRGAFNAVSRTPEGVPIVTASAGNHGLGVAFAARELGRRATVVVSEKASPVKVAALRSSGAELVQVGHSFDDAETHALELAERGAHFVSPYNDPDVIVGQGTLGYELEHLLDEPLTVVCAVGGGGLIAGIALWASAHPNVRVVGAEAERSPSVAASVRAGEVVRIEIGQTIADGISGNLEPGSVTVGMVDDLVNELVTVSEADLRAAIRHLATERGVVAEGAGAAGVAAVLAGAVPRRGRTVAVVSGRNIALPVLAEVLAD
ncbi:threonine dehydratase [Amycolatopsis marina]|uniref:threonine ammonia-lyase n=1 Tax=Amycolatopsis marina TaxID=490629 RepID=A0A1I1C027_9PSEU|nr:pyridoxal-phosphate dependent enzyme [Amycolatopsis marina]SFB55911.1 threonine dehydratase [Amycolatopsis marina]